MVSLDVDIFPFLKKIEGILSTVSERKMWSLFITLLELYITLLLMVLVI